MPRPAGLQVYKGGKEVALTWSVSQEEVKSGTEGPIPGKIL